MDRNTVDINFVNYAKEKLEKVSRALKKIKQFEDERKAINSFRKGVGANRWITIPLSDLTKDGVNDLESLFEREKNRRIKEVIELVGDKHD